MIQARVKIIVPVLIITFIIPSCIGLEKFENREKEEIQKFLFMNPDLNFELKPSGLYYLDVKVGTGIQPVAHDTTYTFYTATFLNNLIMGTNVGTQDTLISPLGEGILIPGFEEALTYMKVGGKSLFIVPSYLGYGQTDYRIPSYTPLLFEVDLVRVKPGPGVK